MASVQVEKLPHSMAKLTITVSADEFEKAIREVYIQNRGKGKYKVPGFPKNNAPQHVLEKMYGPEIFYEDTANLLINREFEQAEKESGLTVASAPHVEVVQIEKGKDFVFTETFAIPPEVVLGAYKGIEVTMVKEAVTEQEILAELAQARESRAREIQVEDRPAVNGDTVEIDYSGSIDGVLFDGGTAQGQRLVIGSHMFIEGFEEQIIGRLPGDRFDVLVTFPEDYHAEELAGKPAVFAVKLNSIKAKELPPVDDAFAREAGFAALADLKNAVRTALENRKAQQAQQAKEDAVLETIIANARMDIADAMIQEEAKRMYHDLAQRMSAQGLEMEDYFRYTGNTKENLIREQLPKAKLFLQQRLVLEAIAAAEGITVSEAEFQAELENQSKAYELTLEAVRELYTKHEEMAETLRRDLAARKTLMLVADAAREIC